MEAYLYELIEMKDLFLSADCDCNKHCNVRKMNMDDYVILYFRKL
jgi:hypothetical protein